RPDPGRDPHARRRPDDGTPGNGTPRRLRPRARHPLRHHGARARSLPRLVPAVPALHRLGRSPRRCPDDPPRPAARHGPLYAAGELAAGAHAGVLEESALARGFVQPEMGVRLTIATGRAGFHVGTLRAVLVYYVPAIPRER